MISDVGLTNYKELKMLTSKEDLWNMKNCKIKLRIEYWKKKKIIIMIIDFINEKNK